MSGGYPCPACDRNGTSVKDSRRTVDNFIRRRRRCDDCGFRFTTIELPVGFQEPEIERATADLWAALKQAEIHLNKIGAALDGKFGIARDADPIRRQRPR